MCLTTPNFFSKREKYIYIYICRAIYKSLGCSLLGAGDRASISLMDRLSYSDTAVPLLVYRRLGSRLCHFSLLSFSCSSLLADINTNSRAERSSIPLLLRFSTFNCSVCVCVWVCVFKVCLSDALILHGHRLLVCVKFICVCGRFSGGVCLCGLGMCVWDAVRPGGHCLLGKSGTSCRPECECGLISGDQSLPALAGTSIAREQNKLHPCR